MITKEEFTKFIESYQEFQSGIDRLDMAITGRNHPSILFECGWYDAVGKMLDVFLDTNFMDYGVDWITYFLWENTDDKAAYVKQDKDMFSEEKEIRYPLDTVDDLWNFLLTDKKLYFKNV